MTVRYVDTSALVRCYLPDEADHAVLAEILLTGPDPVVTSELTRLELATAIHAAHRAGRLPDPSALLDVIDTDCGEDGPIALLRLLPETVLPRAADLLAAHPLRSLDAIHLAVLLETATDLADGGPVVLVTRDHRQAAAAGALGLPVE